MWSTIRSLTNGAIRWNRSPLASPSRSYAAVQKRWRILRVLGRHGGAHATRRSARPAPGHTWPPMALPCQGRAISCLVTRTKETYYYSHNSQTSWLGFEGTGAGSSGAVQSGKGFAPRYGG